LAADPAQWPALRGPVVWLVPPSSNRSTRQQIVEELFTKLPEGDQLCCVAGDHGEAMLTDLLVRHFEPGAEPMGGVVVGTRRAAPRSKAVLIHPPIVAPVPIELVSVQPTALLRLASHLKAQGVHVRLYDMAPRFTDEEARRLCFPDTARQFVVELGMKPRRTLRCGNFANERRTTPCYLFGVDPAALAAELADWHFIDEIYISSLFTYHYEGTHEVVRLLRAERPEITIHLGGVYPTLCPDHARTSGAHHVHVGPYPDIDFGRLDFSLYDVAPRFAVMKLTRGCPQRCSYCAVHLLEGHHPRTRDAADAIDEMVHLQRQYGVRRFVFWESNLLAERGYFESVLRRVRDAGLDIEFLVPEGLEPRLVTDELVELMVETGFCDVFCLPLEAADQGVLGRRFGKPSSLDQLVKASQGLHERAIPVLWFVLIGFAGHTLQAAIRSILFAWRHKAFCKLMFFTPIPGTEEFERARELIADRDLAELAPFCYPLASAELTTREMEELCRLFDGTRYDYRQIVSAEGCVRTEQGGVARRYDLRQEPPPSLARGELAETSAYLELRKEYFLLEAAELGNSKMLLYYDVPERAWFEDFAGVLIGRELNPTDFDFQGATQLAAAVRRTGRSLGVMLPPTQGELRRSWTRLVTAWAADGPLSVLVSDPDALSWLTDLKQRLGTVDVLPGRLLPFRLLRRDSGQLQWDRSCFAALQARFRDRWVADEFALAHGTGEPIPVAVHVPTSVIELSRSADPGSNQVIRLQNDKSAEVEFLRGRGRYRAGAELDYFAGHSSVDMFYEYTIPR
jgi:hypothetical protein